ncbi:MAG: rhomboid family intramembrane serine protease [Agarilytica sp.]
MLYGEFPLGQDLSAINRALTLNNIPHRFTEETGVQKLWLMNAEDAELVTQILQEPQREAPPPSEVNSSTQEIPSYIRELYRFDPKRNWLSLAIIFLGVVGYALVKLKLMGVLQWFWFAPMGYLVHSSEYWRLLTPTFIHFSELHVLFNCIWIWETGKRLEIFMGKRDYALLFICCALMANILQFVSSGHITFGGLSGVVYGYFGCLYVFSRRWPLPLLLMPPAIYGFMLVMLVLGFSGALNLFIDGKMANWAHLGGLIGGLVFGFLYQSIVKKEVE